MSANVFYSDLDTINGKGVLVTGHGKGLVNRNSIVNGKYIFNDMVRLVCDNGILYGYQGYMPLAENELTKIDYLLYFYAENEPNQPLAPTLISVDDYLSLSKHNIETGNEITAMISGIDGNAYDEYEQILRQASNVVFVSIPFTANEYDRAQFVNESVR